MTPSTTPEAFSVREPFAFGSPAATFATLGALLVWWMAQL